MKPKRIQIRGRTEVFQTRADGEREEVSSSKLRQRLHSRVFERHTVLDCLKSGTPKEIKLAKQIRGGGELCLEFDKATKQLWIVTKFEIDRLLNKKEQELLVEATVGQWSDGIGTDFADQCAAETGLFVDLLPFLDDYDATCPIVEIT